MRSSQSLPVPIEYPDIKKILNTRSLVNSQMTIKQRLKLMSDENDADLIALNRNDAGKFFPKNNQKEAMKKFVNYLAVVCTEREYDEMLKALIAIEFKYKQSAAFRTLSLAKIMLINQITMTGKNDLGSLLQDLENLTIKLAAATMRVDSDEKEIQHLQIAYHELAEEIIIPLPDKLLTHVNNLIIPSLHKYSEQAMQNSPAFTIANFIAFNFFTIKLTERNPLCAAIYAAIQKNCAEEVKRWTPALFSRRQGLEPLQTLADAEIDERKHSKSLA